MEGALPYPYKVKFLKWFINKSKGQLYFVDDGKTGKVELIKFKAAEEFLACSIGIGSVSTPEKGFLLFHTPSLDTCGIFNYHSDDDVKPDCCHGF